jgi:hypothetical protein
MVSTIMLSIIMPRVGSLIMAYGASWTSAKRSGQAPVLRATIHRRTSAIPCSTIKNPAIGITVLKG